VELGSKLERMVIQKNLDLMSKFEQPGKDFTTREPSYFCMKE
jgi:hypothetical protein